MSFSFAVPSRRGSRPRRVVFLPIAVIAFGCTASSLKTQGGGGNPPAKQPISFDEMGTLELAPSELQVLHITTAPSEDVQVLLVGGALDASLDKGSLTTDPDGHASVTLKAPSMPASFHVVARVNDARTSGSADLAVAVSDGGFASLRVLPKYLGKRDVISWDASVSVGATCDTVRAALPADPVGALNASASPGGTPIIGAVPVGPKLAVAVHSGSLTWGCVETTAAAASTTQDLTINVTDTPMRLDSANLSLSLDYAPPSVSYADLLTKAKAELVDAAFPSTSPLAPLVLDAMKENVPTTLLQAFNLHRQSAGVDASVAQSFASAMVDPRAKLQGWAALVTPPPSTDAFTLHGLLTGTKSMPGAPSLTLDTFGPVTAAEAGVQEKVTLSWMAQPGDTVVAGGKLIFSPTRLVGRLIERQAILGTTPSVTTVVDALAQEIDCVNVGQLAGGFTGCDATCGEQLCVAGITTLWGRGLAVADSQGVVGISISSSAEVDAMATPSSLMGTWVGSLTGLGATCPMMGNVAAVAVPTP